MPPTVRDNGHVRFKSPRPLTASERATLDAVLSHNDASESLREQAESVQSWGECQCGCLSIFLSPDERYTEREIYGMTVTNNEGDLVADIILFVDDGKLSDLEHILL